MTSRSWWTFENGKPDRSQWIPSTASSLSRGKFELGRDEEDRYSDKWRIGIPRMPMGMWLQESVKGCRRNSISTQIQTTRVLGWWNTVLHTFWLPCRCVGNASERRMCPMCFLVIYQSFGYPAYKYANDLKPKCLNSLPHNGRFRRWKGENTTVIDTEQRSYGAYHEIQPDCGYFMNLWSLPLVFGRGGVFPPLRPTDSEVFFHRWSARKGSPYLASSRRMLSTPRKSEDSFR